MDNKVIEFPCEVFFRIASFMEEDPDDILAMALVSSEMSKKCGLLQNQLDKIFESHEITSKDLRIFFSKRKTMLWDKNTFRLTAHFQQVNNGFLYFWKDNVGRLLENFFEYYASKEKMVVLKENATVFSQELFLQTTRLLVDGSTREKMSIIAYPIARFLSLFIESEDVHDVTNFQIAQKITQALSKTIHLIFDENGLVQELMISNSNSNSNSSNKNSISDYNNDKSDNTKKPLLKEYNPRDSSGFSCSFSIIQNMMKHLENILRMIDLMTLKKKSIQKFFYDSNLIPCIHTFFEYRREKEFFNGKNSFPNLDTHSFGIIGNMCHYEVAEIEISSSDFFVQQVSLAMNADVTCGGSAIVKEKALRVLNALSFEEKNHRLINSVNGIEMVINFMGVTSKEEGLRRSIAFLSNFSRFKAYRKMIVDLGGIVKIGKTLRLMGNDAIVLKCGVDSIYNLSENAEFIEVLKKERSFEYLIRGMVAFKNMEYVQEQGCRTLARFAVNCAYTCSEILRLGGMKAVIDAMNVFSTNEVINEWAIFTASYVSELSGYLRGETSEVGVITEPEEDVLFDIDRIVESMWRYQTNRMLLHSALRYLLSVVESAENSEIHRKYIVRSTISSCVNQLVINSKDSDVLQYASLQNMAKQFLQSTSNISSVKSWFKRKVSSTKKKELGNIYISK